MSDVINKTSLTTETMSNPVKISVAKTQAEFIYELTYLRVTNATYFISVFRTSHTMHMKP